MRLTREQIEKFRAQMHYELDRGIPAGEINELCDLALLGLAQEQNNAAGQMPDQATAGSERIDAGCVAATDRSVKGSTLPAMGGRSDLEESRGSSAVASETNADHYATSAHAAPDAAPCATCNDDPAVCATVPGLRHCEKAMREPAAAAPADRPTLRTDAALEPKMMGDCYYRPLVDFARQLERELAEAQDKIARMRPSEEAVKCAEQVITAERNAFPPIKGAKWGVGFLALTILRIDEEAK